MLNIKTPLEYISKPAALAEAGTYIAKYGKKAIVVSSKTAFKVAGEKLLGSLKEAEIEYITYNFEGYPSERAISEIRREASKFKSDVLIALGGGKVMDSVKAAGDRAGLPVVSIPTIAATCASWAAVSIIYDDEGSFLSAEANVKSPQLILADTDIIATAPERYIKAGIIDTLAKYYEPLPSRPYEKDNLNYKLIINTAQLACQELTQNLSQVIEDIRAGKVTNIVTDAIDMVIYHAGLVGSIADGFYGGFAHTFYNAITKIPGTRDKLHGEKVAFGLIVQFVLEGQKEEEIKQKLQLFKKLDQPITLKQLGIIETELTDDIILGMTGIIPFVKFLSGMQAADIKAAILKADDIGNKFLEV